MNGKMFLEGRGQHAAGGPGAINWEQLRHGIPTEPKKMKVLIVGRHDKGEDYMDEVGAQMVTSDRLLGVEAIHWVPVGGFEGTDSVIFRDGTALAVSVAEKQYDVTPRAEIKLADSHA